MKIEVMGENRLRLLLDRADMRDYGITYEDIDYSKPQTQKVFRSIMDRAEDVVGFSSDGYKLVIEARPGTDGGCILTVTRRPKKRTRDQSKKNGAFTFLFDDIDTALDAAIAVGRASKIKGVGGGYILSDDIGGDAVRHVLREYGKEID